MPLELEQKRAGVRLELRLTIGRQHEVIEELGIEKSRVGMSRSHSIARVLRIGRNGDFLPHFEAHLEVFGDLAQIASELIRGRRSVER